MMSRVPSSPASIATDGFSVVSDSGLREAVGASDSIVHLLGGGSCAAMFGRVFHEGLRTSSLLRSEKTGEQLHPAGRHRGQ
jgi:hypothetical protein